MVAGVLNLLVAAITLVELFDGVADIAGWTLGDLLVIQGVVELAIGATHTRARRGFEMLRGAAMLVFAVRCWTFPGTTRLPPGSFFLQRLPPMACCASAPVC